MRLLLSYQTMTTTTTTDQLMSGVSGLLHLLSRNLVQNRAHLRICVNRAHLCIPRLGVYSFIRNSKNPGILGGGILSRKNLPDG